MELKTVAQISLQVGLVRDRVGYLIRKAKIEPTARAGSVRLYRPEVVQIVRRLNGIPRYDLRPANIETILSKFPSVVA